jgi:hypothetical protein
MKAKMTPQSAVKRHEARMHPGKTPSFKKGGPTTEDRLKFGKNLSRAMNQKTG